MNRIIFKFNRKIVEDINPSKYSQKFYLIEVNIYNKEFVEYDNEKKEYNLVFNLLEKINFKI